MVRDGILKEGYLHDCAYAAFESLHKKYAMLRDTVPAGSTPESLRGKKEIEKYNEKIALLAELKNEVKTFAASRYMQQCKDSGVGIYVKKR